jgi:hypothetical protein
MPKRLKSIVRWIGVFVSALAVIFAILTYLGVWNSLRGDNLLAEVATRFDKSYTEDAGRPVRPGDQAWSPLIRVITDYTHADLPTDKEPLVVARAQAVLSAKNQEALGEWTAPTTPVLLMYKEWPGHGDVTPADYRVVGTLEDCTIGFGTTKAILIFSGVQLSLASSLCVSVCF